MSCISNHSFSYVALSPALMCLPSSRVLLQPQPSIHMLPWLFVPGCSLSEPWFPPSLNLCIFLPPSTFLEDLQALLLWHKSQPPSYFPSPKATSSSFCSSADTTPWYPGLGTLRYLFCFHSHPHQDFYANILSLVSVTFIFESEGHTYLQTHLLFPTELLV